MAAARCGEQTSPPWVIEGLWRPDRPPSLAQGLVGASEELRRCLTRSGRDRRSGAWFEPNDRLIAVEETPDEELEAFADLNIEDRDRSAP